MANSIFSKIIAGELPSHKVYEDSRTIVIVPLHPIAKGHVLVIPKKEVDQFFQLPAEDYSALMETVKKVSLRMMEVLKPSRIGLKVVGIDVPHAHIHVIAFDTLEQYQENEAATEPVDHEKLERLATALRF